MPAVWAPGAKLPSLLPAGHNQYPHCRTIGRERPGRLTVYDLVIRGGTGRRRHGMPARRADVAVTGGRIMAVGPVGAGSPRDRRRGSRRHAGFIDGHTHLDAQIFWDPLGNSSCWHGVTTVVMGNCGFTLAPSREGERQLVIENLEKAEDIPAAALAEGVHFELGDVPASTSTSLDRMPKGINTARLRRTFAAAHVRDGGARLRATRRRRRSRRDGARAARRARGRRGRLHDVAQRAPCHTVGRAGRLARRGVGRGRAAGRRDGRLPAAACSSWRTSQR